MKMRKQVRCESCGAWLNVEYEAEIKTNNDRKISLDLRLFDSYGYESENKTVDLILPRDVSIEELKKRKKLLNRFALDLARLHGCKASYAEVAKIEEY